MNETTVDDLLIAFAAGLTTFIVTYTTIHLIIPGIKKMRK